MTPERVVIGDAELFLGDCLDVLATLAEASADAVVTDPPYGIGFMGKAWDRGDSVAFQPETWAAVLRVMKPGAHLLAFGGTRTYHRLVCAIEDAGCEIRDQLAWVYGSGFPKSMDVSKAIDKAAGSEPVDLGPSLNWRESKRDRERDGRMEVRGDNAGRVTAPATDAARQWQGWGTALKPALEPIVLARKPLIGTVAANVLAHGTGALNVDGCRIALSGGDDPRLGGNGDWDTSKAAHNVFEGGYAGVRVASSPLGRWPANLIHDGSGEVLASFPDVKSGVAVRHRSGGNTFGGEHPKPALPDMGYCDNGSAARFFYCAKASQADRNDGGENAHPTVKPTELMRWLCRLITPPGGLILDPFMGSGSTGRGAVLEGFRFVGIEREAPYVDIARLRIGAADCRGEKLQRQGRLIA